MVLVVLQHKVLIAVVEDAVRTALDLHVGVRVGGPAQLQFGLGQVVVVDVAVPARPDEVAEVQIALLRQHHRQQRIAGDVEGHAQEDVGAALVELATELAAPARAILGPGRCHIELEQGVAGHQRHLVELGHVPGADDDAPAVGVGLELLHHLGDLVDVPPPGVGQLRHCTP